MIHSMVKNIRKISAVSFAVMGFLSFGNAAEKDVLNFGIISTESSQNLRSNWQPMLDDMSEELGIEVKPFFASDYAGVIQGMRFGKVDIAWYGNKSAMEAVDRASGEVFAQVVYDDGSTGYKSYIITHKDNDTINSIEDMFAKASNLTFGNGDPNSTSGYLVPAYYVFGVNNLDANKIFKRTLNANHESNFMAVANKHIDVATFNSNNWDSLVAKQSPLIEKVKVIWESPEISSDPLVWRTDLSQELKGNIKNFFMTYGDSPKEQEILKNLTWSKFKESSNDQLIPTRELEKFKASNSQ
ncbi:phosphonate ABC transporter substrate-binding protein [Ignatzschineria rhizosphaerae]|nr:phosphonate ABC transporter substrate-binding protein [Ignatzschineria rhizosphaerae]